MKAVICTPTVERPYQAYLDALEASAPLLDAAGWEHAAVFETGNAYISAARATMLRKALDAKADVIVFIDHDLSWDPEDLKILIETEGDVVAGTYRFKQDEETYMGAVHVDDQDRPVLRASDGSIRGRLAPGGFLKITKEAVDVFMGGYPDLVYGPRYQPFVDLFNHGAHEGVWWGEDFSFCRRWCALGRDLWIVPNLNLTHHGADGKIYPGNFLDYFMRRPGGAREGEAPWWEIDHQTRSAA